METCKIIDGRSIAEEIKKEIREEVERIENAGLRKPTLGIIQFGDNPASSIYIKNKIKACEEVGIDTKLAYLPPTTLEEKLIDTVIDFNVDPRVTGFIVQLPLPWFVDENKILSFIDPKKDVDGLTPENIGRTVQGMPSIISATPKGIQELLVRSGIDTTGKHAVVIGRSNIVGKPMALLLMQRPYFNLPGMSKAAIGNATVTICHSQTKNLADICRTADIIVAAAGCPGLVTADMIKPGAVVIDVGINRIEDNTKKSGYRLVGDVDFQGALNVASYITPVPGGVGPMTVASLLQNVIEAYKIKGG